MPAGGSGFRMRRAPVLQEIVRQHAEMAAFLWSVYDHSLLHPDENPEMDEERLARLVDRLEAHLDGLRTAGDAGREIAQALYRKNPEAGELFVLRMLSAAEAPHIMDLNLDAVRAHIARGRG
jgi:DNA-directed RNA polymerase specialized sigma24 family protein